MLVLKRKLGEALIVDGRTVIKVVGVDRGWVRLGIEAPPGVVILRAELIDKQKEGGSSADRNETAEQA